MRQAQALTVMMSGRSVFLTGAPGAGKTYVLNDFIREARIAGKTVAVTASTGIAATHVGGTTIHSWSGVGIKTNLSQWDAERISSNTKLIKRFNATDVLVIDEVSMLPGSVLDSVNVIAKIIRKNPEPFGGMQVVLVGDLFQLPPISKYGEAVDFAHLSAAWSELDPAVCYLDEQHRVMSGDSLLDLLSAMRSGEVNEFHEMAISERLGKEPDAVRDGVVTKLYSHNLDVDAINQKHLAALGGVKRRYTMAISGDKAKREQLTRGLIAPEVLELTEGAEVMFVANNFTKGFVNGTRGTVIGFKGDNPLVLVRDRELVVEPHSWRLEEDDRVRAEAVQYPLRLAWAITIHKSQGMSLDAAEIDLSRSFAPGMGYVALSRVRGMDGVFLKGINHRALQLHPLIFEADEVFRRSSDELAEVHDDYVPVKNAFPVEDPLLFQALKEWRSDRASADKVAPFMILHDKTLHALSLRCPNSVQLLMGVPGFGKIKIEKYGSEIINLIDNHQKSTEA